MNRTFKARLDQLEARHSPTEPRAIFLGLVCAKRGNPDDGWRIPASGWRYGDDDIMRQDGESDDELQARALDHAKAKGEQAFMLFRQISESG